MDSGKTATANIASAREAINAAAQTTFKCEKVAQKDDNGNVVKDGSGNVVMIDKSGCTESSARTEAKTKANTEINNLALSLNTAAYELGMADVRQKDLVANVSHDLKTPLTMIRSYAEMIRDLSGDIPEKRNAHLQVIIDETMRMSQLVGDMTSISAMNTKKIVLEKESFDICAVAASILASYEVLQEQEGYPLQ